jgi:hypothetical protein
VEIARCPHDQSPDALMTCADLHADPQRNEMVYQLWCLACGFTPRWKATQAEAVAPWQRLRRTTRGRRRDAAR